METLRLTTFALLVVAALAANPTYDHQTKTYYAKYHADTLTAGNGVTAAPFFSPDHSLDTHTDLINGANHSIDIAIPSYGSWLSCSGSDDEDELGRPLNATACIGCSPSVQRADPFPLFGAILNAAHRGVQVRFLTNNFNDVDCTGSISALPFFTLNGIEVRYYATTTFMHAKYMSVDGRIVSISSVNYSKTSYTKNREAGVVFSGDSEAIAEFTTQVFETDWNLATKLVVGQTYSSAEMAIITNTSTINVVQPAPFSNPSAYITPKPTPIPFESTSKITIFPSPDFARDQIFEALNSVVSSFTIMIYQITDEEFCDGILELHHRGKTVNMLVSQRIFGSYDCSEAKVCYNKLHEAGVKIYKTPSYYSMSHQKFWIVDGYRLYWSTSNWSSSDFPDATTFPPYGKGDWVYANRGYTGIIEQADIVDVFQTVYDEDKVRGSVFSSSTSGTITCGF